MSGPSMLPTNPHASQGSSNNSDSPASLPSDALSWFCTMKPPHLSIPTRHTTSTGTRKPKFHDMHLHESLRLKKIVFLDDLPGTFSRSFDEAVKGHSSEIQVDSWDGTYDYWESLDQSQMQSIRNEKDLTKFYQQHQGVLYTSIASQLKFKDGSAEFRWSTDPVNTVPRSQGIADAFLHICAKTGSAKKNMELIDRFGFSNLAIWEFKSLMCGPHAMKDMPKLAGPFEWKACEERRTHEEMSRTCSSQAHRVSGRLVVTGRKTGPDSHLASKIITDSLPCNDPIPPKDISSQSGPTFYPDSPPKAFVSKQKRKILQTHEPPRKRQKTTKKDTNHEAKSANVTEGMDIQDIIQQAWAEATVDDATFIIFSAGNEEYIGIRHREDQTLYLSRSIVPSLECNPTHGKILAALFMLSYDDALERATTLSSALDPESGSQVDVPCRWKLDLDQEPTFPMNPNKKTTKEKKALTLEQLQFDKIASELLTKCASITLRFHGVGPHNARSHNPNTWVLQRVSKNRLTTTSETSDTDMDSEGNGKQRDSTDFPEAGPSAVTANGGHHSEGLFLDFQHVASGSTNIFFVYLGQAIRGSGKPIYCSSPLIVKIGRSWNEKETLIKEYKNYLDISKTLVIPSNATSPMKVTKGRKSVQSPVKLSNATSPIKVTRGRKSVQSLGIVDTYGLFSCKVQEKEEMFFLLMAHGGVSLHDRIRKLEPGQAHLIKHRKRYERALAALHEKNFAHTNLKGTHIVMDVPKRTANLISLSQCVTLDFARFEAAKAADLIEMENILRVGQIAIQPIPSSNHSPKKWDQGDTDEEDSDSTSDMEIDSDLGDDI